MRDYADAFGLNRWEKAIVKALQKHPEGLRYKEIELEIGSKTPKTLSYNLKKLVDLGIVQKLEELREGKKVGIYRLTEAMRLVDLFNEDTVKTLIQKYVSALISTMHRYEDHSLQKRSALTTFVNQALELHHRRFMASLLLSIYASDEVLAQWRWKHLRNRVLENLERNILNVCLSQNPQSQELLRELYITRSSFWLSPSSLDCPCCGYTTLEAREGAQECFLCGWITGGRYDPLTEEVYCGEPLSKYTLVEARFLFREHLTMLYPEEEDYADTQKENIIITKKTIIDQYKRLKSSKGIDDLHNILESIILNKKNIIRAPPVITAVAIANQTTSSATITWRTDELSDSVVKYGATTPLGSIVSDSTMVTSHSVTLTRLAAGTTYYYMVASTDLVGNTTVDNNNGKYYTFITRA